MSDNQYRFQESESAPELTFCLRMLQWKYRKYNKELHTMFVNLEKVYYCEKFDMASPDKETCIKSLYENCPLGLKQTEEIKIDTGLHQEPALNL